MNFSYVTILTYIEHLPGCVNINILKLNTQMNLRLNIRVWLNWTAGHYKCGLSTESLWRINMIRFLSYRLMFFLFFRGRQEALNEWVELILQIFMERVPIVLCCLHKYQFYGIINYKCRTENDYNDVEEQNGFWIGRYTLIMFFISDW